MAHVQDSYVYYILETHLKEQYSFESSVLSQKCMYFQKRCLVEAVVGKKEISNRLNIG